MPIQWEGGSTSPDLEQGPIAQTDPRLGEDSALCLGNLFMFQRTYFAFSCWSIQDKGCRPIDGLPTFRSNPLLHKRMDFGRPVNLALHKIVKSRSKIILFGCDEKRISHN